MSTTRPHRSDSVSSTLSTASRNDVFNTTWKAEPPPRLLPTSAGMEKQPSRGGGWAENIQHASGVGMAAVAPSGLARARSRRRSALGESVDPGRAPRALSPLRYTPNTPESTEGALRNGGDSPRTASFFASAPMHVPSPPPPLGGTPSVGLSRAPSLSIRPDRKRSTDTAASGHSVQSPISPILLSPITPPPVDSASEELEVQLESGRNANLGAGRYARVVKGRYMITQGKQIRLPTAGDGGWHVCAVKVPLADDKVSLGMIDREARIYALLHSTTRKESNLSDRGCSKHIATCMGVHPVLGLDLGTRRMSIRRPAPAGKFLPGHLKAASDGTQAIYDPAGNRGEAAQSLREMRADDLVPLPSLVLEYLPVSLDAWLIKYGESYMDRSRWLCWAEQLTSAVAWCHSKGVLHGDIKPGNVMIDREDTIKLVDFGSSLLLSSGDAGELEEDRMLENPPRAQHSALSPPSSAILSFDIGTAAYSAPELLSDSAIVAFPSDLFSLGVTLWQMMTCRQPYSGRRTIEVMMSARRGQFWDVHERDRLARVGGDDSRSRLGEGATVRRTGSLRAPPGRSTSLADSERVTSRSSEDLAQLGRTALTSSTSAYYDGAPAMYFPAHTDRVEGEVLDLIKSMTFPAPVDRPSACEVWRRLQVHAGQGK